MQHFISLLILCCCFCGEAQSQTSGTSSSFCDSFGGNGVCDDEINNEDCDWDGGDCCPCTCISDFSCGDEGYDCRDPDSLLPPDGFCDSSTCGYDSIDCCPCTCSDCSESDCLEPTAPKQVYDCKDAPAALPTCVNGHLEVENTAQARNLVEAINCSGGVFNVSWKGNIVLRETIWVVDGTVLNVNGIGWDAEIDGNGVTRLFTVINASLHISNMKISNGNAIGGGAIGASSSTLMFYNTSFTGNTVSRDGGAIFATEETSISFVGETVFNDNTASSGGAIFITDLSSAFWEGSTSYIGNVGGALSVGKSSNVAWAGPTFFSNNIGNKVGGAIYVDGNSKISWMAETRFYNNNALKGGALSAEGGSVIWWNTTTFFSENTASEDGGAIYVDGSSSVSWTEDTDFSANSASTGGALFVEGGSSVRWLSGTNFSSNTAFTEGGGAIYVGDDGEVAWTGKTIFSGNDAHRTGGAVAVVGGSIYWDNSTSFVSNSLRLIQERSGRGGALYIGDSSDVSWTGKTVFENNTAGDRGGGIFIALSSTLKWSGETNFSSNYAGSYGGAVGSEDVSVTTVGNEAQPSSLNISSATHFLNNSCDGSGGGMALLRMLDFTLSTDDEITFAGNTATTSGGGVYISGMETGPKLFGMRFVSNLASSGGGLYAAGSHTEINESCFIDNYAEESGGAIDSFHGVDSLMNTEFRGNGARVGGALTLFGKASMANCSFLENTSDMDGGPAVFNSFGSFQYFKYCLFLDNIFKCDAGTYFSFNGEGHKSETVCYDCDDCDSCDFGDPTSIPVCEEELHHTTSNGSIIEKLIIDRGYWRATNVSTNILGCFNDEACNGGVTGDPGFCEGGYEGAYCSVCAKNYAPGLGHTCTKCSDPTGGIIFGAVLTVLSTAIGAILVVHLVSGDMGGTRRSLVDRITRNIPLHTLKIVIVTWQILTQFAEVARVTYPDVYQGFLNAIDLLNFDLSWVLSLECLTNVDFHGTMLFSTAGPIVIMGILGTTYMIAARRHRGSTEALRNVWHKHLSMVLLLTFLVYSSVSSVLIQMFDCEKLDDEKIYLRADYSIQCDSDRHRALMVYSTIMILVYPVGIPVLYICLLFSNSTVLIDGIRRETDESVQSITDLWKPYRPSRFYYEVIECGRRLLLTGGVFLIDDDTTAQVSVIFMLAVCFALLLEMLSPYESRIDVWVSRTGHAVVYGSMYFALLLKAKISEDSQASQNVFEWVLITMQVILVVLVVINGAILAYSSREENREGNRGNVAPRENFAGLVVSNRDMASRVRALSNPRRKVLVVHPS